ncbi:hypothetical protein [Aquimarina latercula]|uniref:hypothetical protein n=1 Tax=Aquimarina latercula TaxID=987 RepID=UPI0004815CDC|nr:hypothetical protein [Aquimarina latercula]
MKVSKENTKYLMNWDSKKIWKEEIISKEFIKYLKEKEVYELIKDKNTQLGIISERDIINWIEKKENQNFWEDKMEQHICEKIIKDDDDYFVGCDYEDFKDGYFFVASLWKIEKGENLIILEHYH